MGDAFQQAMLSALANVARGFGDFFMAQAAGALAAVIGGDVTKIGAVAKWTTAAMMMYAAAGAMGGIASSMGGGGGKDRAGSNIRNERDAADRGDATILIEGGLLDTNDPRQMEALARAIESVEGRRVVIRRG